MSAQVQADPKPLPGGECLHCGGKRKLEGLKPVYRSPAERDPFCTRKCCEDWYAQRRPA